MSVFVFKCTLGTFNILGKPSTFLIFYVLHATVSQFLISKEMATMIDHTWLIVLQDGKRQLFSAVLF